jgi:predicted ATPase
MSYALSAMLTRLRVSGFKNLLDLDVRLAPFTCFVGPNGVGKSNLFDAVRFLRLLASHPVPEAVARLREAQGRAPSPSGLFTAFGGYRSAELRIAADMIVDRRVIDDYGVAAEAAISTLRYEIAFRIDDSEPDRLVLTHESLLPLKASEVRRTLGFAHDKSFEDSAIAGVRRGGSFITTGQDGTIQLHQDGHGGRKVPSAKSSRTVLSGVNADFPSALAALREMQSWRTLLLEPSAMRAPSLYRDPRIIDERGAHLAGTLARLVRERGEGVLTEVANRLAELIDDVHQISIEDDQRFETLTVHVRGRDGIFRPATSLSDGTLRFLVLATLCVDPTVTGTLCLEEPENGIHPDRVEAMVKLLRDLALDPNTSVGEDNPLRQVLVNTHSPLVYKAVRNDDRVFMEPVEALMEGVRGTVAQARVPNESWRARCEEPRHEIVAPARLERWTQLALPFEDVAAEE